MSTPRIPRAELQKVIDLIHQSLARGHKPPGAGLGKGEVGAIRAAANASGLTRGAFQSRVRCAEHVGLTVDWSRYRAAPRPGARPGAPEQSPLEVRNVEFWRRRATALVKELAETQHVLAEVAGMMSRPPAPATWATPSAGRRNRAAGLLTISDIHAGEVIRPVEVSGLNSYDLEVCRTRLRRLFDAAVAILPRWAADCKLEGVFVALNGDLVSGEIHDELRRTNAITSNAQVWFVADELAAGLEKLAAAFGKVFVCVTPGNHGRSTLKTHAKGTADLSYDTMVGEQLRRYFARDKRVEVSVSPSRDAVYKIFGWTVLQTHNDAGGGGGQGFAGPMLPVLRKGKSIEWMAAQSRVFYDIMATGHYHTSGNLGKILANGSVVGYGEFAQSIRASPEPPQQWLALIHEQWCIRERCEVKLDAAPHSAK